MQLKKTRANKFVKNKFNAKKLATDMIEKRTLEDISTRVAASDSGLDKQTFNSIEFGRSCTIANLVKVCNWLKKPVSEYF